MPDSAARAEFCDDDEIVGIGMQGFLDETIGDMRAIKIARIDMVHAAFDSQAQHGQCRIVIFRRPEDAGAGKLHCAIAKPLHAAISE
jgi:hypothetical protein